MRELFIYFRAPVADETQMMQKIQSMQRALCEKWPGLAARCLRRPDAQGGLHTWMETYAAPAGVTGPMEASIAEAAQALLPPLVAGERHVEAFIPCPA